MRWICICNDLRFYDHCSLGISTILSICYAFVLFFSCYMLLFTYVFVAYFVLILPHPLHFMTFWWNSGGGITTNCYRILCFFLSFYLLDPSDSILHNTKSILKYSTFSQSYYFSMLVLKIDIDCLQIYSFWNRVIFKWTDKVEHFDIFPLEMTTKNMQHLELRLRTCKPF